MIRSDIVAAMAASTGWTKAASDRALRALLASIRTSLKRGQSVTLVGFGTFCVSRRKPRRGKNPRTGLPMNIPDKVSVGFIASTNLRSRLNDEEG